ncbi:MAG: hypothetical protein ACPGVK_04985 [Halocynthiibacter sp.]
MNEIIESTEASSITSKSSNIQVRLESHHGRVVSVKFINKPDNLDSENKSDSIAPPFLHLSHHWFTSALGLFEAFPLNGSLAEFVRNQLASDHFRKYLDEEAISKETEVSEDEKEVIIYNIENFSAHRLSKNIERQHQLERGQTVILKAQLLALVAEYEVFMCDLFRLVIKAHPKGFISKETTILASDILEGKDIESLKNSIIEKKIAALQRESHVDQIKTVFDKLGIQGPDAKSIKEFGEICLRRNLHTHADGQVNSKYYDEMKNLGYVEADIPEIGTKLQIDQQYLKRSTARVFQMGYFSLHLIWQKLEPKQHEESLGQLIAHSHDFLINEYTKVASRICDFLLNKKSPANERHRATATINKALAISLNPDIPEKEKREAINSTLETRDWSITDSDFDLALSCVTKNYDNLGNQIDRCVSDKAFTEVEFLNWALFIEIQAHPVFIEKMEEHFSLQLSSPNASIEK